jgi:S1-C subfamily serine protease
MRMSETQRSPLVSCSPFAIIAVLCVAALWVGWKLAAPLIRDVHDPKAQMRLVEARGDLAQDEKVTIELFKNASMSVVNITTSRVGRDRFRLQPVEVPQGTGSGIVWDERGYILTNLHVLQQADRAIVTLDDRSEWEAQLVGFEADFDVAVLKIDAPRERLRAIPIGTSADLQVGQKTFAIGNPYGLDHTLSTGVVSGLHREIISPSGRVIRDVIQTDAAINPGNSGGPLLDSAGRLIGMNTAIVSESRSSAGIGFAVPIDTINTAVPGLIRRGNRGSDERPVLGVLAAPEPLARLIGTEGVVVETVQPGSGAEKAGLRSMEYDAQRRPIADVITSVAGQRVTKVDEIWEVMGEHKAGDVVTVEVVRAGKPMRFEVTLRDGG